MSLKLGSTTINKLYLGSTEIKKAYLGSTLIYDKTAQPFVSTWDTTKTSGGSSAANQIMIPVETTGTYNCTVDWGDGTSNTFTSGSDPNWTHTYASSGVKTITITGQFEGFRFVNTGDKLKLSSVASFGPLFRVGNSGNYFHGCTNLTNLPWFNSSSVTTFIGAFYGCLGLTSFPQIDTSSATNFQTAWNGCLGLTSFPQLDTSSGTTFYNTWRNTSLTSFPLLDFSSGLILKGTWQNCSSLTSLAVGQGLKMPAMTDGTSMLETTTFTTEAYSRLLEEIALANTNTSVPFHGGNAKYNSTNGAAARTTLVGRGWTITDGGPA